MSKWIAEELIKDTHKNVAILRIAGIFGLNGPRHLFLNNSICNAVMKHIPPKLIGEGIAKRNYIYVKDVAKWIYYIAENDLKGTFYLASKDVLNIKEMAESICEVFLDSKMPERVNGSESHDQVCGVSEPHPDLFSFTEALRDIKMEYEKNSSHK
jgi:nucleoside-diphosphate-sugar epimerase